MRKRISYVLVSLSLLITAGLLSVAGPASAAQQQNANLYAYWNFAGHQGFWNIDQQVHVSRKAEHSYWAMMFAFTATPGKGGYLGLQTNAKRFNGSTGDTAIFSLWNATATQGANCGKFSGEGSGLSCRVPYAFSTAGYYRFRVWRLAADASGQWWGAWIQNTSTGQDTPIGQIRVAKTNTLLGVPANFSEYWGSAKTCNTVPVSVADFTQPAANFRGKGVYDYGSVFARSTRGSCTGGSVRVVNLGFTRAARVTMGGHR